MNDIIQRHVAMTRSGVEIVMVAEASREHPRHGGADMIELKDGSILLARMQTDECTLEHAAGDDAPSDILRIVSRDGGKTWTDEKVLVRRAPGETAVYRPGLLRLQNSTVLFRYERFHHFVKGEPWSISAYACFSRDEGRTFSEPIVIWAESSHHSGSQGDLRQLSSGRIVIPIMYMEGVALQDDGKGLAPTNTASSGCYYSDDNGHSWSECENYVRLPKRGALEPKIEELKDGRLLMIMRTQLGQVYQAYSADGGTTWQEATSTGLQAPESCPCLRRIPQTGDLALIWNDSPYNPNFDHYGVRSPLSVTISKDEGASWAPSKAIESDPAWEYTNPVAIVTRQDTLVIAYEASKYESLAAPGKLGRSRMHLKVAIIDLNWLYEN